jgi:hypothetical protein
MRRYRVLLAALVATVVLVPSGSAARLTPTALYRALLTTPIAGSSLPSGFAAPVSSQKAPPSPQSQAHHAVGVIRVFLNGGADRGVPYFAGAYYVVFPSRQEALAEYEAERGNDLVGPAKSFPAPARIVKGSLPNGGIRYEGVEFVDENVRVFAYVTNSGENPLPQDALARALSLGAFMRTHLEGIRSRG